jgi:hypothetical protein
LTILKVAFGAIADSTSLVGFLLQYIRYTTCGIVGVFFAPAIFTRIGLASIAAPQRQPTV